MHALRQTVVLTIVGEIGTITSVENLKFRILSKDAQVFLGLFLTLFVDECNGGFNSDGHRILILG